MEWWLQHYFMVKRPIHRLSKEGPVPEYDELAEESIITIRTQSETIVRLLASPFDLGDLAQGHITCEGRGVVENITVENIQSNKMIKKVNGYFINPYSFKEYGGSDIFYVAVLRKQQ